MRPGRHTRRARPAGRYVPGRSAFGMRASILPAMPLHAATIFVSAFLLFLVQPILAKQILPWFGGAAIVWTSCMVFFQLVLLLGYAYAHWLSGRSPAKQAWIHIGLL